MAYSRAAITAGLSKRATAGIKVRQPLASATVYHVFSAGELTEANQTAYLEIIRDELNVKVVKQAKASDGKEADVSVDLDFKLTPELKQEGLMRELVRNVQQARKQAGLEVDDRINLWLESADEEITILLNNNDMTAVIKQEVLADSLNQKAVEGFTTELKVEGKMVKLSLVKVKH